MGVFNQAITLFSVDGSRAETVNAMVDAYALGPRMDEEPG